MPASLNPNAPRYRALMAHLSQLTAEEWDRVASRYDDDSEEVHEARGAIADAAHGLDHRGVEPLAPGGVTLDQQAQQALEQGIGPTVLPEKAKLAARDAIRAVLLEEHIPGEERWAVLTLLRPFDGFPGPDR
jgi:hypothetical protein